MIKTPGRVERVNVALLIGQELSPALQAQIEELTGAAVGYDLARGDTISVVSIPFVEPKPSSEPAPFPWAGARLGGSFLNSAGNVFPERLVGPPAATVDMVVGRNRGSVAMRKKNSLERRSAGNARIFAETGQGEAGRRSRFA